MATVTELRNEWAEAVEAAGKLGDNQEAFEKAWADAEAKRAKFENARKVDEAAKALALPQNQVTEMTNDLRNVNDARIHAVSPDAANEVPKGYVQIANKAIVPFASTTTEGWIKKLPVACQHPDILARLGPELRQEKAYQEQAFALYFRGGVAAVRKAADGMGAEGKHLIQALNALQEDTDSEGGYFVPTDQRFEVIRDPSYPAGVVRPRSTVFTTTRDGGTWPTTTTVTWATIAEEASNSDSDPVQGQVPFTIHKSGANNRLSIELLSDSAVTIPALLGTLYSESKGRYEDQQSIEGDGATEPLGLRTTGSGSTQGTISAVTDLFTLAAPTAAEVINAFFELPAQYRGGASWFMTSSLMSRIVQIGSAAAGIHFIGDDTSLANGVEMTLLGKPVFFYDGTGWDDAATISANEVLGAFGDFRQYYFIDRMGMSVARSDDRYFDTDQVAFKARARYDSLFAVGNAFRLLKAAGS